LPIRSLPLILAGLLAAASIATERAWAGPWLAPGDTGLRSDIELLADSGILAAPITTWPLSWGDIGASLEGHAGDALAPAQAAALARVQRRYRAATVSGRLETEGEVALAAHPRRVRTFEDGPRENLSVGAAASYTGDWVAGRLQAQYVSNSNQGQNGRLDGSYLGVALGNWMIAAAQTDRFWGPGWQSSLVLSNNARPFPAFTLERNRTARFESRWLHWIPPYDVSVLFGFLENDRDHAGARVFGARLNFKPFKDVEIGVSRLGIWCGRDRPCGLHTFWDLFVGNNIGGGGGPAANSPGDQVAGYDARWSLQWAHLPVAVYAQWIGNDLYKGKPSNFTELFGIEATAFWQRLGSFRYFIEFADTECGAGLDFAGRPDCAYNDPVYTTGERFHGRTIGHSFDNDSEVFTLGVVLNDVRDRSWTLTMNYGDLNKFGFGVPDPANTLAPNRTRYREAELSNRRTFVGGDLNVGVGYEYRLDTVTDQKSAGVRAFVDWRFHF
jgi:hypothetical protein